MIVRHAAIARALLVAFILFPGPVRAAYRSASFGFEMDAPPGWSVTEQSPGHVTVKQGADSGLLITIKVVDKDTPLTPELHLKLKARELQSLNKAFKQVISVPMSGAAPGQQSFHHGHTWQDATGRTWVGRTTMFHVQAGARSRWFHVQGHFVSQRGEHGFRVMDDLLKSFKFSPGAAAPVQLAGASPSAAPSAGTTDPAAVLELETWENSIKARFVKIPAGSFQMGSTAEDQVKAYPDRYMGRIEAPRHAVQITRPFYMGVHEVSRWEWEALMRSTPWSNRYASGEPSPHKPATGMSFYEAVVFCNTLSGMEKLPYAYTFEDTSWGFQIETPPGFDARINVGVKDIRHTRIVCDPGCDGYRLPSEAEWEYACRAGMLTAYHWGDDPDLSLIREYANCGEEKKVAHDDSGYGSYEDQPRYEAHEIRVVGRKRSNRWGLYDMVGNAAEWVNDAYDADYYSNSPAKDPRGPDLSQQEPSSETRVVRGGYYGSKAVECRSADRKSCAPRENESYLGFRVVRTIKK